MICIVARAEYVGRVLTDMTETTWNPYDIYIYMQRERLGWFVHVYQLYTDYIEQPTKRTSELAISFTTAI